MWFGTGFGDLRRLRDGDEAAACIERGGVLLAGHARRTTMTWAVERERGMHHTQRRADAIGDGSHTCRTDCAGAHCATAALDRTEGPVGCTPSAGRAAGRAGRAGRTVSRAGRDAQAALPSTMPRASRAAGRAGWLRRATPTTGRAGAPAEHRRAARTTTASTAPARKKRESHIKTLSRYALTRAQCY